MSAPFFSIIIPTRNRYETLKYAILTVLSQEFKSFELIISDNSDEENLGRREIIDGYLKDERIHYCRPSSVLSMSDNWEFAVSQSSGEYIIIFGDDDGLVAGSLNKIYNIIQKTKADLVSWARIEYSWPDRTPPQVSNLTVLPYRGKTGIIDSKDYIKKVISCKADYRYLPMFYNSAVSKKTVGRLKEKTGRIFHASSPDIYTGYAFAHLLGKYITVSYPLSINGVSSKSNGAAHYNDDESIKGDHWKLLKKSDINWPASLPEIYTSYLGIIEPYIQLTKFFPELKSYISRKKIYKIIVDTLESNSAADLERKIELIIESSKNNTRLHKWLIGYINKVQPKFNPSALLDLKERVGLEGSYLTVDASKFEIENVYDISIFANNLFGNLKDQDYLLPIKPSMLTRLRRAAGILLRPD